MKTIKLNHEEQAIEDNFDKLGSYAHDVEKKKIHAIKESAKHHRRKDKRITIRIYEQDLLKLKDMAMDEGLPYQTFITMMLHKLSLGRLKEAYK